MKENKKGKGTLYLTRAALIAAAYAVIAYLSAPLQFLFFQFRISEAFCVLAIFMPEAIPGMFLGCFIANYLSGCVFWDVLFGSIATLIGAIGARLLSKVPEKMKWIATLPTILANAIIIPFVIIYAYQSPDSYWFLFFSVALGEVVTAGILGTMLYYQLRKKLNRK